MHDRLLYLAFALLLASLATAGVPDLELSTAVMEAPAGSSIYVLPSGAGPALTEAFSFGGDRVDATITLTLIDTQGDPIFGYPFEDMWLETSNGGMVFCAGGSTSDASTDADGQTTWTNPLLAGGYSFGETTHVIIAGAPLVHPGFVFYFNSPDINGDLEVDISDIALFTQTLSNSDSMGDFNNDGVVDISDIARFTAGLGSLCQ